MQYSLSRFLSYLLHPLLMPFYSMLFIFSLNTYINYSMAGEIKRLILLIVFLTCFLMPVTTAFLLLQKGWITSLGMNERRERRIPFLTTIIYYLICYLLVRLLPVPALIPSIVAGGMGLVALSFIINLSWKISIHMIGLGGLSGIIWMAGERLNASVTGYFILSLVLAGLAGWARLYQDSHTPLQIYAGYAAGLATMLMLLNITM